MLVLNRRLGERIVVGENIIVTVLSVRGGAVKLGFSGPADVAIHREEVHKRLASNRLAVRTPSSMTERRRSPATLSWS